MHLGLKVHQYDSTVYYKDIEHMGEVQDNIMIRNCRQNFVMAQYWSGVTIPNIPWEWPFYLY